MLTYLVRNEVSFCLSHYEGSILPQNQTEPGKFLSFCCNNVISSSMFSSHQYPTYLFPYTHVKPGTTRVGKNLWTPPRLTPLPKAMPVGASSLGALLRSVLNIQRISIIRSAALLTVRYLQLSSISSGINYSEIPYAADGCSHTYTYALFQRTPKMPEPAGPPEPLLPWLFSV